jgi:hypothetical protein
VVEAMALGEAIVAPFDAYGFDQLMVIVLDIYPTPYSSVFWGRLWGHLPRLRRLLWASAGAGAAERPIFLASLSPVGLLHMCCL